MMLLSYNIGIIFTIIIMFTNLFHIAKVAGCTNSTSWTTEPGYFIIQMFGDDATCPESEFSGGQVYHIIIIIHFKIIILFKNGILDHSLIFIYYLINNNQHPLNASRFPLDTCISEDSRSGSYKYTCEGTSIYNEAQCKGKNNIYYLLY